MVDCNENAATTALPRGRILSPLSMKLMELSYNTGTWTCFHPYGWCSFGRCPMVLRSAWKLWIWRFNVLVGIGYWIFVTVRSISVNSDPSYSTSTRVYMQFMVIM